MTDQEASQVADQAKTAPFKDCKKAYEILTKDWCGVALVSDDEEEVRTWLLRASAGPQD